MNIEENSRRNYGTCPQVQQQDGSIDPSRLSSRRSALSIPRNLRYFYTMSSTNNSALSLRDFGRKFCRAPPSTLTPALLDFKNRARLQIFTIFFDVQTKFFSVSFLSSSEKERRYLLTDIVDHAVLGRAQRRANRSS